MFFQSSNHEILASSRGLAKLSLYIADILHFQTNRRQKEKSERFSTVLSCVQKGLVYNPNSLAIGGLWNFYSTPDKTFVFKYGFADNFLQIKYENPELNENPKLISFLFIDLVKLVFCSTQVPGYYLLCITQQSIPFNDVLFFILIVYRFKRIKSLEKMVIYMTRLHQNDPLSHIYL